VANSVRLTPGMFGREFGPRVETPFNLHTGQMRSQEIAHNGGWFNQEGERLGWGDLAAEDFVNIQRTLEPGDMFFVLGESDSFWNFVRNIGPIGSMCSTSPTIDKPGVEYVRERFMYLITPERIYCKAWRGDQKPFDLNGDREPCGILVYPLSREDLLVR